jgi:heme/copper-type cytochrome/quinol oxidase subunit 4
MYKAMQPFIPPAALTLPVLAAAFISLSMHTTWFMHQTDDQPVRGQSVTSTVAGFQS